MKEELRGIAVGFAILAAVVAGSYAFTAAVGAGPPAGSMAGLR